MTMAKAGQAADAASDYEVIMHLDGSGGAADQCSTIGRYPTLEAARKGARDFGDSDPLRILAYRIVREGLVIEWGACGACGPCGPCGGRRA